MRLSSGRLEGYGFERNLISSWLLFRELRKSVHHGHGRGEVVLLRRIFRDFRLEGEGEKLLACLGDPRIGIYVHGLSADERVACIDLVWSVDAVFRLKIHPDSPRVRLLLVFVVFHSYMMKNNLALRPRRGSRVTLSVVAVDTGGVRTRVRLTTLVA